MFKIQYLFGLFLFFMLSIVHNGISQELIENELEFEVNKVYPYILVKDDQLRNATTLLDLNDKMKMSWIKSYKSVEVSVYKNGVVYTANNINDTLTHQQKTLLLNADLNTDISVEIQYWPNNNLSENDIQQMDFSFTVFPEKDAEYLGGQKALNKYLKVSAIDLIPDSSFVNYDMSAINFTINELGEVVDAQIFDSGHQGDKNSRNEKLLLNTICNMPNWTPAEYANGVAGKQKFVLTVGNMANCDIHLLGISRY